VAKNNVIKEQKMHKDKLPPPITAESSRKEMYLEIRSLRREIDDQQREIDRLNDALAMLVNEKSQIITRATVAEYQLDVVRKAVELTFKS
jgi:hypothetical protein